MKKTLLTLATLLAVITSRSQAVIDTVSIGAGYANQVWYSLSNDNQGSAPKNNWDLAFDCSGMGSTVLINSATGTLLWNYPKADTSGWNNIDTTGITNWVKRYNSDTSWALGAMGRYASPSSPFDVDWGQYSMITHFVTGDSVYIIKLANGQYKKLWLIQLANSTYSFRYADLNGANGQNASISKTAYATKNLVYYSLQTATTLDREPVSTAWDLVFTQYTAFIPTPYTVTGILQNKNTYIAEVPHLNSPATYNNWSAQAYNPAINIIGYDWKTFTGTNYVVNDSLLYFVKTNAGDIWKLLFTGFGGSANGNYIFTKERLSTVGIKEEPGNFSASLSLYPNPATNGNTALIYSFETGVSKAALNIFDLAGKNVYADGLNNNVGLHTYSLDTAPLQAGMYIVSIDADGRKIQQKLIIQ